MGKYFGTDGIRGKAERFTTEFLDKIILGLVAYAKEIGIDNPKVLIGGDNRESTEWILANLASALESLGIEYSSVEILPTPAINYVFYQMGFDFAIDVTASHNPYTDNGIKILERGDFQKNINRNAASHWTDCGRKLSAMGVAEIEQALESDNIVKHVAVEPIESLHDDAVDRYVTHLMQYVTDIRPASDASFKHVDTSPQFSNDDPLKDLHLVLDFANGATSQIGDNPFVRLGALVHAINTDAFYGQNINHNSGSTHLESLIGTIKNGDYDFGAAFDGDGDRCLLVDHTGEVVTGDQIIAIFAKYLGLKQAVVTVMANQGIYKWAKDANINLTVTDVGDTNVALAMQEDGILIGGEESGHVILPREAMGDGMLVALLMAKVVATTGKSLAELASTIPRFPQLTTNVSAHDKIKHFLRLAASEDVIPDDGNYDVVEKMRHLLQRYSAELDVIDGRLLVRPSGTESLVRVTLWGSDLAQIQAISRRLVNDLEAIFKQIKE